MSRQSKVLTGSHPKPRSSGPFDQFQGIGESAVAVPGSAFEDGAMAQFSSGPRLLAVIVESQSLDRQQSLKVGDFPEKIDHCRVPQCAGAPQRQVANRPQMILELAGDAALDGPVP